MTATATAQTPEPLRSAGFTPLPTCAATSNAGQQCDMLVGPCACGAWHLAEGWVTLTINGERVAVVRKDAMDKLWPAKS